MLPILPARGACRLACGLLVLALAMPGRADDRRERYRALALDGLGAAWSPAVEAQILELLDAEILDSLRGGSVFASPAFIRERLQGLADAWGGATLEVTRAGALTVGAFHLGEAAPAGSVRVYGTARGEPRVVRVVERPGRPRVHVLGPGPGGAVRLLVAWEGPGRGPALRELRLDLLRLRAEAAEVAPLAAELAADPLLVRSHAVHGGELSLRYALRYPGWVPGCEGQTEREDLWRLDGQRDTLILVRRRVHDAWHREVGQAAARLLDALAANDGRTLAALIPDAGLRRGLPRGLVTEPACDARDAAGAGRVGVAALELPDRRPWTLIFARHGGSWRLRAASPVLQ